MAEVTGHISYKKGEIAPLMISVSSPIELSFSILTATCEIRKQTGELVLTAEAEIDNVNKRVSYAWNTLLMESIHYNIIFWLEIDTDSDGEPDYKISSEVLTRYVKPVSALGK